eukprot:13869636-Alexandrium_andersonii.AAC.1
MCIRDSLWTAKRLSGSVRMELLQLPPRGLLVCSSHPYRCPVGLKSFIEAGALHGVAADIVACPPCVAQSQHRGPSVPVQALSQARRGSRCELAC